MPTHLVPTSTLHQYSLQKQQAKGECMVNMGIINALTCGSMRQKRNGRGRWGQSNRSNWFLGMKPLIQQAIAKIKNADLGRIRLVMFCVSVLGKVFSYILRNPLQSRT
ncbi:hypothetical protein PILCRDRAFT_828605 [Piloderma croceum F 1598]|uniref:Uncharacterized protein n=1 Tax=Piloderma croceum (strain F 1598) TaxID=765440 RepID=A0A0C3F246_PILCF|nr:hypothetical protein PILCRDRAFT_828605 [Piloderma croceum F 1598]